MITQRVKVQLAVFLVGTLVAMTYIGINYAHVDRLFGSGYTVTVQMAESGGIFTTADVTYRGVSVGRVTDMWLDGDGVKVEVRVDPGAPDIPADTDVVIASRSAVGEQFLDFQPRTDRGPFLDDDSVIARERTQVPVDTRTLLSNVSDLLGSVDNEDLSTVITELGAAFEGSSQDLRTIIDSSNSFITEADQKYEVTAALIKNSTTVLQTQVDSQNDIRAFAKNLRALSTAVRSSDQDLRQVIDSGAPTATTLRALIDENGDDIAALLDDAITVNSVVRANLPGVRGVLVIAPYGVESAFSIIAKDSRTGQFAARMSLSLQPENSPCLKGYQPESKQRTPYDRTVERWDRSFACAQKLERGSRTSGTTASSSSAEADGGVVLGTYDVATKQLVEGDETSTIPPALDLGEESWKWMMLGPAVAR
ncbi:MCE family protein [Aeromicrobium sp. 636]|uniref:MCE family protein n=1 Tax=Aeromicrobium senzhongii TaxID=2663859 RepID=A0A8I0K381_9ACTN|nr:MULTISPECIES: MlaD family protein [Aeromicrobium]MBC9227679.1 MCE family protein [Aeromicrobium senzhongii]MCQ3999776.1 MCE family protein [Aeromicrobium sp. 636]MTB89695.1 MCE family protein [Aeromicrobium senzhongii]QNL94183.1 MCE family protein [Aeromicrobium senzhongii]